MRAPSFVRQALQQRLRAVPGYHFFKTQFFHFSIKDNASSLPAESGICVIMSLVPPLRICRWYVLLQSGRCAPAPQRPSASCWDLRWLQRPVPLTLGKFITRSIGCRKQSAVGCVPAAVHRWGGQNPGSMPYHHSFLNVYLCINLIIQYNNKYRMSIEFLYFLKIWKGYRFPCKRVRRQYPRRHREP